MSPKMFRWMAFLLGSLVGCASVPARAVHSRGLTPAEEARAIEAAKRHPIAHPEPRSLYPEQSPPPLPTHGMPTEAPPPPESGYASGFSVEAPPDESEFSEAPPIAPPAPSEPRPAEPPSGNLVAPSPPPADNADAPSNPAPGPGYVWAPGYWSWAGTGYLWVVGDWLRERPGFTYVRPSWTRSNFGWEFSAGGWSRGGSGTVAYPVYRHPYGPPAYQVYRWPDTYEGRGDDDRDPRRAIEHAR